MNIGLLGPTYAGRSTNILGNRCVNWIPELNPQDSKGPLTFFGSPGADLWATTPILLYPSATPVRAMHVFNNYLWMVAGATLFRVDPYGTMTYILTLVTSSGPVYMKDNGIASLGVGGNQLIIIDQANVWIYNVVTLTVNSLSTSPSVLSHIEFIDGYIIGTEPGTMRYRVSDLYDAYTSYSGAGQWGALSFASVESASDPLMGVVSVHEQVYFLKHFSTEIWYNTGTPTSAGSPFTRLPGGVLDVGTISTASIAKGAQTFFFLGQQRSGDTFALVGIYMMNGYIPTLISPPSINYYISTFPTTSDAFGFCITIDGHTCYVITFPTGDSTFVYDTTSQMWWEWSSYVTPYHISRYRASCYVNYNGLHLIGDYQSGNIYRLSTDLYDDYNQGEQGPPPYPIVRERIAPHLFDKDVLRNLFCKRLQIDMETGVGLTGNPYASPPDYGSNPQAMLSWSDDGGHTYSSTYTASLGLTGQYKARVIFNKLGVSRDRVFKFSMSDPVKANIIGGYAK